MFGCDDISYHASWNEVFHGHQTLMPPHKLDHMIMTKEPSAPIYFSHLPPFNVRCYGRNHVVIKSQFTHFQGLVIGLMLHYIIDILGEIQNFTFLSGLVHFFQGWFTPRNIELCPWQRSFYLNTDFISDTRVISNISEIWTSTVNEKSFLSDKKRSSKIYFGYSHMLEMGTHFAILDTEPELHISVNCHKRYSILDNGYYTNCHILTLNIGCNKILNIGYSSTFLISN